MKDFVRPKGRLPNLPFVARLVYSIFLAFTLAALGVTVMLGDDMVGVDLSRMDNYYAGVPQEAEAQPEPSEPVAGGPVFDLPDDVEEDIPEPEPLSTRKLLEVTHFHLFSMPVYLMILAHLYMLSRQSERAKTAWITVGTLSVAAHMVAPWVARSPGSGSHFLYGLSGAGLFLSFLWMSLVPLYEMWLVRARPTVG